MSQAGKILLDGADIYNVYGVFAIRGSFDDLMRLPSLKPVSTVSYEHEDSEDVDLSSRQTEARDITLKFLMRSNSIQGLNTNRTALFNALKQPGIRIIVFNTILRTYEAYYKSCESATFYKSSKPKLQLTLKFRLLSEYNTGSVGGPIMD